MNTPLEWLIPLLVCPVCRGPLALAAAADGDGFLEHRAASCPERYPIIDGIPRLLVGPYRRRLVQDRAAWFASDVARRQFAERWSLTARDDDPVVSGFDFEWKRFSAVGRPELREVASMYFDLVPPELFDPGQTVLDAGCGAGRWTYETATRGPRVVAVDLGLSIEVANKNTLSTGRVACVQADLTDLPLRSDAADWAYCLGVIHHMVDPIAAMTSVARSVRASGLVLLYVYYALDNRGPAYRALFRASDVVRRVVSRLPRPAAFAFATAVAALLYLPLARSSALLARVGLERLGRGLPLSFYRGLSLEVMRNDSLDRFGTARERRYTRAGVAELMAAAGLVDIRVSTDPPYWHAIGTVSERRLTN